MSLTNGGIDGARLLADLHRLRGFGTYKTGVHRPTYSAVDMAAREWLCERMREAGMTAEIDGIGNVIGRSPAGLGGADRPRLLLGSHLESQNQAGWLDGALGVMYALEIARSRNEQGLGGVDVGAWADEEGHYGAFLGSRSAIGELSDADIAAGRHRYSPATLPEALAAAGLAGRPRITIDAAEYAGYLEAHIEQGDSLEASGQRIGVVTSIVGIWQFRIDFEGVQNHAGTTRMAIRRDAGVALVQLANEIERLFPTIAAERSVWTVGRITLSPGAQSIVPGAAEMLLQFRDADAAVLARLEAGLRALVATADAGPCRVRLANVSRSTPMLMDAAMQAALGRAATRLAPGSWQAMPSGAGHDAQYFARIMPSGMLFVPSIGGISHHHAEDTAEADIVLGCAVLGAAVAEMLGD